MNGADPCRETLAFLQARRPDLVPFFYNAAGVLSSLVPLDAEAARVLRLLSLASQTVYIDPHAVMAPAVGRGELKEFAELLYELAVKAPGYAGVFASSYPALPFPAHRVRAEILDFVEKCLAKVGRGEKAFASCLAGLGEEPCRFLLRRFTLVAFHAPGSFEAILARLPRTRRVLSPAAFAGWIARGTDLMESSRVEEGVRFLLGRSRESRSVLGAHQAVLEDVKNVLKIYGASLAGRELAVVSLESSSFGLKAPYCDGKSMFLPPEIGLFAETERNERIYTVLAAQQAASVAMGTFDLDLAALDFKEELRARYATALPRIMDNVKKQYGARAKRIRQLPTGEIEAAFPSGRRILVLETEYEKFFYSFPFPDFAKELFTLVENSRIERALSRRYPGLREDYLLLNTRLWRKRPPLPQSRVQAALECLFQYSLLERYRAPLTDPRLQKLAVRIAEEFSKTWNEGNTVADSARICFRLYTLFSDNLPLTPYCTENDVRNDFQELVKQAICPEIVREASPELLKEEAPERAPEPGDPDEPRAIELKERADGDAKADPIRSAVASGTLKIYRYPEYDHAAGLRRQKHCTLYERTLDPVEGDYCRGVLAAERQTYGRLRKRFLSMRPEDLEISRRWPSGEEIDIGDAVDYSIDLLRGACPEENIYSRRRKNTRDVLAAILLDASSSTKNLIGGQPIIDTERKALVLLASSLAVIGDDFGIFAFNSHGRNSVHFHVVKDFLEPWNARTQGRIPSIEPFASNRDGCAIRHATARLLEQPQRTKLLLLLSDGIPADIGYGSDSATDTSPYAIEDTREAIRECRMGGIVPFCITIDRSARGYIEHLYGDYRYTVIDDVSLLPERLSRLYLRLTD